MYHLCVTCYRFQMGKCKIKNIQLIFYEDEISKLSSSFEKLRELNFIKDYVVFDFGEGVSIDIIECSNYLKRIEKKVK